MADLSEYHRILVGVDGSRQAKKKPTIKQWPLPSATSRF